MFLTTLFLLCFGCHSNENIILYNATMVARGQVDPLLQGDNGWFNESFLKTNKVSDALYLNENYDPNDSISEKYVFYSEAPKEIIIVIDSIEKEEQIFNTKHEVDYDKEILILRLFGDTNCSYSLNDVVLEDGVLRIIYNVKVNVTTDPVLTCMVIKMDKIEYETIEFKGKNIR